MASESDTLPANIPGDGAGIGPEQVAKCAAIGFMTEHCSPIICGDTRVFGRALTWVGAQGFHYEVIEDFDHLEFKDAFAVYFRFCGGAGSGEVVFRYFQRVVRQMPSCRDALACVMPSRLSTM